MDFARVKSKLNMGYYMINEQMLADVQQVFRNCDLYNTDETDVFAVGRNLERYVVKRCKELSLPFIPSDMQKGTVDQNGPPGRAANSSSDDDDDDDDDDDEGDKNKDSGEKGGDRRTEDKSKPSAGGSKQQQQEQPLGSKSKSVGPPTTPRIDDDNVDGKETTTTVDATVRPPHLESDARQCPSPSKIKKKHGDGGETEPPAPQSKGTTNNVDGGPEKGTAIGCSEPPVVAGERPTSEPEVRNKAEGET